MNASSGTIHISDFTLIPVSEESVPLLARWLSDPRVLEFYEGRDSPYDEDMVRTQFLSPDEYTERFIVYHSERPIAYLQLYSVHPAKRSLYGVGEDESPFGMDLFIGEPDLWDQGLGSRLVQQAAASATQEPGPMWDRGAELSHSPEQQARAIPTPPPRCPSRTPLPG